VWWRPVKTAAALLPALDEKGDRWQRQAAFKVLPKTKEKSVVFPIVRWIVKEPDLVVPAMKEIGPAAEDEAIKLLRQKDATVRANAARILGEVGTKKSTYELTRASKDPRDPGAAAAAKLALEAVKSRVAATTAPAAAPEAPAIPNAVTSPGRALRCPEDGR
jgi:HEAT repeat protein